MKLNKIILTAISTCLVLTTPFAFNQSTQAHEFAKDNYLADVALDWVILDGYDVTAFFTEGKAIKGDPRNSMMYKGAIYYFETPENLAIFQANPEKYRPLFGGHCSMAMALGRLEPGDVVLWAIIDDQLVVQRNIKAKRKWSEDPEGYLKKAKENWQLTLKKLGKQD